MECADTLGVICSFLQKRELAEFGNVSQLCRAAAERYMGARERRYFTRPCVRENLVELVPPSQILALQFLAAERKLLVLVRAHAPSPALGEEVECCLYVQEALPEGVRSDHRVNLPSEFGLPTSHVHFEGTRFLCCTTREGALTVFDCAMEMLLELPMGYDGFHASPDGRRCVIDHGHYMHYCKSSASIRVWREVTRLTPARSGGYATGAAAASAGAHRMAPSRSGQAHVQRLQARLSLDDALLTHPLGSSSSAWRAFWVGQASVLYAHESGVQLFKERRRQRHAGAAPPPLAPFQHCGAGVNHHLSSDGFTARSPAAAVGEEPRCPSSSSPSNAAAFDVVELAGLAGVSAGLAHSSCSTVSGSPGGHDEYVIFNCRDSVVTSILVDPPLPTPSSTPAPAAAVGKGGVDVRRLDLSGLVRPRSAIIKEMWVAEHASTYMVFLSDHSQDRLLLFTADGTLTRWITIGEPSTLTLLPADGLIISACLPDAALSDHPVLQTMAGGVGSVFSFSEESHADVLDPTVVSITVSASLECATEGCWEGWREGGDSPWAAVLPWYCITTQDFNGVELLSWAALGVVSASLAWTVSALVYNGWWLHLQLLFCGKVN